MYSTAVHRRPRTTASVRLPAAVSVGMSRRLLTTRIAVMSAPGGIAAATKSGSQGQRLQVRRADDRDEPEEDEDEDLAEGPVAVRERTAGVGERGHDRERRRGRGAPRRRRGRATGRRVPASPTTTAIASSSWRSVTRPAAATRSGPARSGVSAPSPMSERSLARLARTWSRSATARHPRAVSPGTASRPRAPRRAPRRRPTRRRGAWSGGPRGATCGARHAPRGAAGAATSVTVAHGRRGNFVKSGDRFSRKARDPSCASSVV